MLDFLTGLGKALSGRQAVKTIGKRNYGDYAAREGLDNAQGLAGALADPEDPRYKAMYADELDNRLQDYTLGLQDLINANRRQSSMGRTPLFDAERGGEDIWRALQLGRGSASAEARDATDKRLRGAYSANIGVSNQGADLAEEERRRKTLGEVGDYRFNTNLADAFSRGSW